MSQGQGVYDLGNLDPPRTPRLVRHGGTTRSFVSEPRGSRPGPGLAGSLSLLVPGAGQLASGEPIVGLFFASGIAFIGALLWALGTSLDRVLKTLTVLGLPPQAGALSFGLLCVIGAGLHVWAVLHAIALAGETGAQARPHPVSSALASMLLPGWGQLLNGHVGRCAFFLTSLWLAAIAWLAVSPLSDAVRSASGLRLPPAVLGSWGPVVLLTTPAVLWALSVYDAIAGAISVRRG